LTDLVEKLQYWFTLRIRVVCALYSVQCVHRQKTMSGERAYHTTMYRMWCPTWI